ncbi:MAG TPA: hypothetical protein VD833_09055 [Vicinamibacterales bacterium]|nr:hypothetical protein [Vicinamibacterales bacterium]
MLACLPARAQIVERVLAVVGGQLILLSDCLAALRFGLVDPPPAGADPVAATLPALIERQLQLAEINRYLPPEPAETLVDERLRAVRGRFPDDAAFEAALAETGLGAAQLRGMLRDDLRIASYRQQRFTNSLQPTEDELARYYRAHAAEFARDGAIPSFEQARAEARKRLIAERSSALIADWIEGLRRRAEVTILYRAQGEPAASGLASATS